MFMSAIAPTIPVFAVPKTAQIESLRPYYDDAQKAEVIAKIKQKLEEQDAVLVAHYYVDEELQALAERVHVDEELMEYIIGLARFTREHRRVYLGVSPRASLMLLHAAKARALVRGRNYALPDDIKVLAPAVLPHRILLAPEAELEGVRPEEVVKEALEKIRYQKRR